MRMLKSFRIIEDTDESTTYVYNTYFSWILLVILIFLFYGIVSKILVIQGLSILLTICYFSVKIFCDRTTNKKIRLALKTKSVELSGNKYSFSNPLKVKVPKDK